MNCPHCKKPITLFADSGRVGGSTKGPSKARGGPEYYRAIAAKGHEARRRRKATKEAEDLRRSGGVI